MKGRHLGEFEFLILAALLRLGEEAYGVEIRRTIEDTIDRPISMGAVYSTLDRLERKGLAASRFGDPTPERGGKAKRFFHVTSNGREAIERSQRERALMTEGLELGGAS